jgi:hypothetical protein
LNIEQLNNVQLSAGQNISIKNQPLKSSGLVLPANWIGKQAYSIPVVNKNIADHKPQLVLVPFADASQSGGAMQVWLPLNIAKE